MARQLTAALFQQPPITLLTVHFAGRQYRFSSYPVTILGDDGTAYRFRGGLPPTTLSRSWQLASDSPTRTAISFQGLIFPDDLALLIAQHHDLANATAEVALWQPGLTYENRLRWLVGDVVNPIYDSKDRPVSFTVERQPYNDRGLTHDPGARVSTLAWPSRPAVSQERWYPIPIGYPGRLEDGTITRGSPAIVVARSGTDVTKILIADREIHASHVRVFDNSGSERMAVTTEADGNNRMVSVVDMTSYGRDRTLDEYWIGFSRDDGGGIYNRKRTAAMEGIGEVLIYALGLCSVPIDTGAWGNIEGTLNGMMKVAGYIDEPATPWPWTQQRLLPLVPVDVQSGPAGLYPVLWKPARAEDAVAHLTAGAETGVVRIPGIEYTRTKDKLINAVIVRYGIRADTLDPYATLTVTPQPESGELNSATAARSFFRYQVKAYQTLESRWLWSDQSASNWAAWTLRDNASLPRKVRYQVPLQLGWLCQPGRVITITDEEVHFSQQVARVQQAAISQTSIELELVIRRQLGRDRGQR